MKNVIFFITHKTLGIEHAEACFYSLSKQENVPCKFDALYIYNTHQDELSNDILLNLYEKFNLNEFFTEIKIFNYNSSTEKALGADISVIRNYVMQNYVQEDRVLLLKSDCLLSKNYFNDILSLPADIPAYFVAPFICAKERIPDTEIFEYISRDLYIPSDDITFFVEDQFGSNNNDFFNRPGVNVTDNSIKFTSCYVIRDFSCHFLSVGLFDFVNIAVQSWGGVNFSALFDYFTGTGRSFVVHKYHGIISENRTNDREGPVVSWLKS
jgi:hypothetical protein